MRLVLLAGLATAAMTASATAAPAWTVDRAHSRLGFDSALGGVRFSGAFQQWDAAIAFDPRDLETSGATVSVDLASARTGDRDRDGVLPGGDWFAAARFPKAAFATTGVKPLGGGRYLAAGVLTLKGVSRPVALPFALTIHGNVATMTGAVTIDRSQWRVGEGQFAGEDPVPHAVTVQIAITAVKK
jgi:polyisoprenoid-binding protein YceI